MILTETAATKRINHVYPVWQLFILSNKYLKKYSKRHVTDDTVTQAKFNACFPVLGFIDIANIKVCIVLWQADVTRKCMKAY